MRKSEMREFFDAKRGIRKFGIISRPAFRFRNNNHPQHLAALHLRGLLFLLCRSGMKRTLRGIGILPMEGYGLAARATGRERGERAVVRNRDP
jgi:hypothetical protein